MAVVVLLTCCGCDAPSHKASQSQRPAVHSDWQRVGVGPAAKTSFRSLRGSGPNDIWALGSTANADRTWTASSFHFDGVAWRPASVPARATEAILPLAPNDVWAVGMYGTVAHFDGTSWKAWKIERVDYDLIDIAGHHDDLYVTSAGPELLHFDGIRWQSFSRSEFENTGIYHIATLPSGEVLVPLNTKFEMSGVMVLAGGVWSSHQVGPGGVVNITGSAANDVWAVGAFRQAYHFDGKAWTRFALAGSRVISAYATSPTEAYLVGDDGVIQRWDGTVWKSTPGATDGTLWTVYAPPGMRPLVGGDDGMFQLR